MKYIAIISDIIGSQKAIDKYEDYIINELSKMEKTYKSILSSRLKRWKGDEIQLLISQENLSQLFQVIRHLKYCLLPFKLRIGIGIGEVYNHTSNNLDPFGLNGEAFYNARNALKKTKIKKNETVNYTNYIITSNENLEEQLNFKLRLLDILINKWSWQIYVIAHNENLGFKHEDIALIIMQLKEECDTVKRKLNRNKDAKVIEPIKANIDWKVSYNFNLIKEKLTSKVISNKRSNISTKMKSGYYYEVSRLEKELIKDLKEVCR